MPFIHKLPSTGTTPAIRILGPLSSRLLRGYYMGFDHPAKIRFWLALHRLLGTPRLTLPFADKSTITVDINDYVQSKIYHVGIYEPEVWNALRPHFSSQEVLWDVGAHIGGFGIRASELTEVAEVHFFEPNPKLRPILEHHISLNPGRGMHFHPFALGDRNQTVDLHLGVQTNIGGTSMVIRRSDSTGTVTAECLTADTVIERKLAPPPTLLKVDIEGAEMKFLNGAKQLFSETPPKALVIETESNPTGEIVNPELREFFQRYGYEGAHIQRPGEIDLVENFLFVHTKG